MSDEKPPAPTDEPYYAQAVAWKADPSKLKEWLELRSLVVLQRLEAIASQHPNAETAEKASKSYFAMAKQLVEALHAGKILDEKRKRT